MNTSNVALHGYRFSVYHRIARFALELKQVQYSVAEVDPFDDLPEGYLDLHPFGRVPTLTHDAISIYETAAITRYVDRAFAGGPMQPETPLALARMDQVISIVDNYGYRPLVRQVFAHSVFRPLAGLEGDRAEIEAGLDASRNVLSGIERIALENLILNGSTMTLADCHLAPMISYFTKSPEGAAMLQNFPALSAWWTWISCNPLLKVTAPDLSKVPSEA